MIAALCCLLAGSAASLYQSALQAYSRSDLSSTRALLDKAKAADPRIGEVRGRGAMIAIELVDPTTGDPDAQLTGAVAKAAHAEGVIILTCGTYGNVIRLLPPLSIPDHLLIEGLDVLLAGLAKN